MQDADLNEMVAAWIAAAGATEGTPRHDANRWATDLALEWVLRKEAESLWRFILAIYPRDLSETAMAMLAAGPLEDLLAHFGPDYIGHVERLAGKDERFNRLLGGVWRNAMTDDVWARVCAVRKTTW